MAQQAKVEQERAIRRRGAILDAAIRLLVRSGMAAVSHRSVAAEAGVALGAIRYYYETREALLLACVDRLDQDRSASAQAAIQEARERRPGREDLARLLLLACDGPRLDDDALRGTIGWVADCGRESPALSDRLVQLRHGVDRQVRELLDGGGHADISATLVAAVIDGSVFTSTAERKIGIAGIAIADVTEFLTLASASRPQGR
ncbi:TetR/AcrR family transcriptional regulator [Propionicicella superfundia]|uniref:TetR/AcrR family transcriptional regulator n=1 Tax=Propionicicella superfundia TaxID=348582 RepID=UPI0004108A9F|nr:TetR family transcriptional regulator [Propionicicella superfundia]